MLSNCLVVLAAAAVAVATTSTTNPWATYPPVPKTATYNGFADRIYDDVAECARACISVSTSSTPCPYWDTGCLCVWSSWGSGVAQCVASACQGQEVVDMTSLAQSACSVAGLPEPFWFVDGGASSALASAAANTEVATTSETSTATSEPASSAAESSAVETSSLAETSAYTVTSSTETGVTSAPVSSSTTNPWATFPTVPRTATYNGFADRIYDDVADCAKACIIADTSSTPCPYWDTGCLCVMSNWGSPVAQCVAANCRGQEVVDMTSLAESACSAAGVPSPFWFIDSAAISTLSVAAAETSGAASSAVSSAESVVTSSEPVSDASSAVASSDASSAVVSSDASSAESSGVFSEVATSTASTARNEAVPTGADIISNVSIFGRDSNSTTVARDELFTFAITISSAEPLAEGTTTQFTIPTFFYDFLSPITLATVDGTEVGTVTGDAGTNVFTVTFNSWAASHSNIAGTFTFNARLSYVQDVLAKRAPIDTLEVTSPVVVLPVTVVTPGKEYTTTITIDFATIGENPADVPAGATNVFSGDAITSPSDSTTEGPTVTSTNLHTTIVTVTSCSDNKCTPTTSAALVSTATAVVDGTTTVYTTWCPLTDTTHAPKTTVVTVTSCSENKCVVTSSPYHVTTLTSKGEHVTSTITTYVPITSTVAPVSTQAPGSSAAPHTAAPTVQTGAAASAGLKGLFLGLPLLVAMF